MNIISTTFESQQQIPERYTCKGENVNPPLKFLEVPENTKSLTLIIDDPDAPSGTWTHWVVFNIDPQTQGIEENTKPTSGVESITSFGKVGYGGPCPPPLSSRRAQTSSSAPSGTHRYFFKLYALDTMVNLGQTAEKTAVEKAMQGHVIDHAELVGLVTT